MSANFNEERKLQIGSLNKNRIYTPEEKHRLRISAYLRYENQPNLKARISKALSREVILYNMDGTIHSQYIGVRKMAKHFGCCHKTINKCIKNQTLFKNIGRIEYVDKSKDR
uniref:Homing endonuclease n=1 Tax=Powellomyces hirtus TaxID=109895 RepID=A0A4P8NPD4_9FUNG|nr:Homing endonuclease [Powellomyces hirtus]